MNPFALAGPPFLLFYLILMVVTLAALVYARRTIEGGDPTRVSLTDPYAIAYLRGGPNEALRVASISLVDRGLLHPEGTTFQSKKHGQSSQPLEAALLEKFREFGEASAIFSDKALLAAADPIRTSLTSFGLLPGTAENRIRIRLFLTGLAVLWGVAGARFLQAMSRGRRNVGFLIFAAIVAAIATAIAAFPQRTVRGDRLLLDVRVLFSGLLGRARSLRAHSASPEIPLLAAVFGVGPLLAGDFGWIEKAFPKSSSSSGGSSSSSCGTTASTGSSCGGGCGGGGGGCGGCGG